MNVSGTNDEALGGRRPPLPGSFGRGGGEEGMVSCGGKRGRRRMLAGLLSCSNETKTKFEEDACSVDGVPRGKREWRRGGMKKWRSRVGPPSRERTDDGRPRPRHRPNIVYDGYLWLFFIHRFVHVSRHTRSSSDFGEIWVKLNSSPE